MHQALVYILRPIAVAALSIALTCAGVRAAERSESEAATLVHHALATNGQATTVARPRSSAACSEFGAGFVRMPGSDSCIRVGGSIGARRWDVALTVMDDSALVRSGLKDFCAGGLTSRQAQ